jgi:hypothetical protein
MKYIEHRKLSVVSGETFGNFLLMQCGRFIQYAKILDDPIKTLGEKRMRLDGGGFKNAPIPFLKNVEIFNVRSTCCPHIF